MNKLLLSLTIIFGVLFVGGLTWFIVSASLRTSNEPTPGPAALFDSDEDGLNDAREQELGTDPSSADTDQDGLTDQQEVEVYRTNPLNNDSDGDGYIDGVEVRGGYNPLGPN